MKKVVKSKLFIFILGFSLALGITNIVYAISASEITYNDTTVEEALNTLYGKAHISATEVATLTTQGATYTMQNDGYIVGKMYGGGNGKVFGHIYIDGKIVASFSGNDEYDISLYAPKDSVVSTRQNYGNYNLTVYEWK